MSEGMDGTHPAGYVVVARKVFAAQGEDPSAECHYRPQRLDAGAPELGPGLLLPGPPVAGDPCGAVHRSGRPILTHRDESLPAPRDPDHLLRTRTPQRRAVRHPFPVDPIGRGPGRRIRVAVDVVPTDRHESPWPSGQSDHLLVPRPSERRAGDPRPPGPVDSP